MIINKVNKVESFQIFSENALEPIADLSNINMVVESEIETSSLASETLQFNNSAFFQCELKDPLFSYNYVGDLTGKPFYLEYYIPIMVQARWHKKPRINKKWLKRYGMKKDKVLVRCNIDSITPDSSYDPYDLIESTGFNLELGDMQYKFRQDQLRKNLKIEKCYE